MIAYVQSPMGNGRSSERALNDLLSLHLLVHFLLPQVSIIVSCASRLQLTEYSEGARSLCMTSSDATNHLRDVAAE